MPEVPEFFNRRYKDLDELILNISARSSNRSRGSTGNKIDDPGIKLMCDFWGILKENPDYDLTRAVKHRVGLARSTASPKAHACNRNFTTYPVEKCSHGKCPGGTSCDVSADQSERTSERSEEIPDTGMQCCDSSNSCDYKTPAAVPPLNKALKNLKEAASCERRCASRIEDLINTQKDLQEKIKNLETRELEGIELLKEADAMWCSMEGTYKQAIETSLKKQQELIVQLKDIEKNNYKWRRAKKDLDGQLITISKTHKETLEKISQKSNDIKTLDSEIADFRKRIENNNKNLAGAKTVITNKKKASEDKIAALNADIEICKKKVTEAKNNKYSKETEGQRYVKEAREDLQKINKLLLQKNLEYEDTKAENEVLEQEVELIKQTCDQCKDRCKLKKDSLVEDIKKVTEEIDHFKLMCKKCQQHTDTDDAQKLCSDCPRCKELCRCKLNGEYCENDPTMECVCSNVKEKLLDNVFENMYTVLERKAKSKQGKAIAEAVMKSLKNSRNGKLNNEMRSLLHDFVLSGVKKNLNLTIEGGAVKTRCEMDADVHNQLMLCLNKVVIAKPPTVEKGVASKKKCCQRWGETSECNCPGGAKSCMCSKLGPPAPPTKEPKSVVPAINKIDEESDEVVLCPHKKATKPCGPDCAKHETFGPDHDVASWRPDPCSESACPYGRNVRAAQCVLGIDVLNAETSTAPSISLHEVDVVDTFEVPEKSCSCSKCKSKICSRGKDTNPLITHTKTCNTDTCNVADEDNQLGESVSQDVIKNTGNDLMDCSNNIPVSDDKNCVKESRKRTISFEDKIKEEQLQVLEKATPTINTFTFLTESLPGQLVLEVDDETFNFVERNSAQSNTVAILKRTDSRHHSIAFGEEVTPDVDIYQLLVKSSSGETIFMKVKKEFLEMLMLNDLKNTHKFEVKPDKLRQMNKSSSESKSSCDFEPNNLQAIKIMNNIFYKLKHKCKNRGVITIKVIKGTNEMEELEVPLSETPSGTIAIDMKNLCKEATSALTKYPVNLMRSESGSIILKRSQKDDHPNTKLSKTGFGTNLLTISDATKISKDIGTNTCTGKCHILKIKNSQNYAVVTPVILKPTLSNNYIAIPNKEYIIQYKRYIKDLFEHNMKYNINFKRSDSEICTISYDKPNAYLIKSDSSEIKIMTVNEDTIMTNQLDTTKKIVDHTPNIIDEVITDLSKKRIDKPIPQNTLNLNDISETSNLYEKIKIVCFNEKDKKISVTSSAVLKKTKSGHYAVILNKESQKILLKNVRSCMRNKFETVVPIKIADTGEITIALNKKLENGIPYGKIKVNKTGDIRLIIDDEIVKEITQTPVTEKTVLPYDASAHMIGKIMFPVNKAVATTCNAQPDCCCDISKCKCAGTEFVNEKWELIQPNIYRDNTVFGYQVHNVNWSEVKYSLKSEFECEINGKEKSVNVCTETNSTQVKLLQHIILEAPENKTNSNPPKNRRMKKKASKNKSFIVTKATYPLAEQNTITSEQQSHVNRSSAKEWDSMMFLPPQLPDFLKEFDIFKKVVC